MLQENNETSNSLDMFALADKLRLKKETKKALEDQVKELNQEIDDTEKQLVAIMTEEEMQNFTRNGRQFILTIKTHASAKAGQQPLLYSWLKDNGYGDLVKETVYAQTLTGFVKELLEESEELPSELQDLVNVYDKPAISIRKK